MINMAKRVNVASIAKELKNGLEHSDIRDFDIQFHHDGKITITISCQEGSIGFRNKAGIMWDMLRDLAEQFKEKFIY